MATLNGVEFQILTIEWATYQNNVVQEVIGGDTVVVHSQGYRTDPVKIQGRVRNEKELDTFQEEFYSGGALTFIKDVNSGRQYQIYALGNIKQEDSSNDKSQTGIVFNCLVQLAYPYMESSEITTRSKTITTQNQEWSVDNDSNDIDTDGNVDALPDIQVTGGTKDESITQTTVDATYVLNAGAATVTISNNDDPAGATLSSAQTIGQTISCGTDGMAIIDSIRITVDIVNTAGDVTCTVYDAVGGTSLGSKLLNIAGAGNKTFTFATPIAAVKDDTACTTSIIYFKFSCTGSTSIVISDGNAYAGGQMYLNVNPTARDVYFSVSGHSAKEVHQTFQFSNPAIIVSAFIKGCDYTYAGANAWTAKIYEGVTLLGTGTAATPGAAFAELEFIFTEESTDSLSLSASTEYTLKIYPPSDSINANSVLVQTNITSVYVSGVATLIEDGGTSRTQTHDIYFKIKAKQGCKSPQIYNTADSTIKCNVANDIINTAIHRINVDGTGTINYDDDITTDKYYYSSIFSGVTYNDSNNELDIADDGYIYWKKDTKLPIEGIPTLTSRINITSGIPTIQISIDASTWYNIDTAIVDNVETVYPLDSDGNLSLAGKTIFYFRIDCVKAAAATCSIKYFELDINIHTIYAKNPKITKGSSASTFRIDQDSDSGMACIVALIYRDKWWV